jgi:hypothetical protein
LDIPIKAVKVILESASKEIAVKVIEKQISNLNQENLAIVQRKEMLCRCLSAINSMKSLQDTPHCIVNMEQILSVQIYSPKTLINQWEEIIMTNDTITSGALRIITLPAMRVAVCNVISASPEDEALSKVVGWADKEGLMGTARIFGFNTTAYNPGSTEYGWAACITVPEHIILPEYLKEKRLSGGLNASLNSTNEVYDSWQILMRLLKESNEYEADENRPCLEEHIRSGEPRGEGNDFYLNLLEPVSKK